MILCEDAHENWLAERLGSGVQREMDEREASAEGIVCANEGVMEEFRARQDRAAELGGTLAVQSGELAQQRATVDEMKVRSLEGMHTSQGPQHDPQHHTCIAQATRDNWACLDSSLDLQRCLCSKARRPRVTGLHCAQSSKTCSAGPA